MRAMPQLLWPYPRRIMQMSDRTVRLPPVTTVMIQGKATCFARVNLEIRFGTQSSLLSYIESIVAMLYVVLPSYGRGVVRQR